MALNIVSNKVSIPDRYKDCPKSLLTLARDLREPAEQYQELYMPYPVLKDTQAL